MASTTGTHILLSAVAGAAAFGAVRTLAASDGASPWVVGALTALGTLAALGTGQEALANGGHHAAASLENPEVLSLFSEADLALETPRRVGSVAVAPAPADPYQLDLLR